MQHLCMHHLVLCCCCCLYSPLPFLMLPFLPFCPSSCCPFCPYPCSCPHHCLICPCLVVPVHALADLATSLKKTCYYSLLWCETFYTILQEPLITPEEANARLTSAQLPPPVSTIPGADGTSPKSPEIEALPEGFELSPFSPSVRWAQDRKARKLASGATAVVYRFLVLFSFSLLCFPFLQVCHTHTGIHH